MRNHEDERLQRENWHSPPETSSERDKGRLWVHVQEVRVIVQLWSIAWWSHRAVRVKDRDLRFHSMPIRRWPQTDRTRAVDVCCVNKKARPVTGEVTERASFGATCVAQDGLEPSTF